MALKKKGAPKLPGSYYVGTGLQETSRIGPRKSTHASREARSKAQSERWERVRKEKLEELYAKVDEVKAKS